MKHFGEMLRQHIEKHGLVRKDVAEKIGLSYNYLSAILNKPTIDCELMEKICVATGLPVTDFLEGVTYDQAAAAKMLSDIKATTVVGHAKVNIGMNESLYELLLTEKDRTIAEKERYIKLLERQLGVVSGTETEQ